MIGGDVQDRGHPRAQGPGRLQLEAGDFQDVELDPGIQEIQGGLPQVATHRRPQPTCPGHLADQGRDRALAVGAGDGDDGGLGGAGKELDVAHHLQTAPQGDRQALVAHGNARTDDQAFGRRQGRRVEVPQEEGQVRHLFSRRLQPRGLGPGVGHRHGHALGPEIAGAGQARLAEPQDQGLGLGRLRRGVALGVEDTFHQRILRLASPTRTRMTLRIQKRTMTRGSGQPLSSK